MHKDRNASFNVHFQPRLMHVSSHNVFGLTSSFSCYSTFSFFGICGVIFQSANRAADDIKMYQFVSPLDQGRFRMIESCEDTDIRYEICLLINNLFTVPMERLGSFRAVWGGDGLDVLFLCQYCEQKYWRPHTQGLCSWTPSYPSLLVNFFSIGTRH